MKTKGKTKLEDLEVKKIDAVDIGADQKANILIKVQKNRRETFSSDSLMRFVTA